MKPHSIATALTAIPLLYVSNARIHAAAQIDKLCASTREFGFINRIMVDGPGITIADRARAMAAKKLVLREVPTILVGHLNAVQELADIIANDSKALDAV